jgi:phosphoglycolate phosphatase
MSSQRPYRLLVFDWDGTLMDSIGSIVACMQTTLEHVGVLPVAEERIRQAVGMGIGATMDYLLPDADEATRGRVTDCYRNLWFSSFRERPLPFAGVEETLSRLRDDGYLLAVATGKGRRGLLRDFESSGLGRFFHASRTADETFAKPHPRMVDELLDELGAGPGESLVVGDTTFDLEMAKNAGVPAVAVLTGSHGARDLQALSPLACLPSVRELRGWLGGSAYAVP